MSFFGKLFGKKEKESLDQGLQKTKEGFLSKITKAIADAEGNFISFGQFASSEAQTVIVTMKVAEMKMEAVKKALAKVIVKIMDIREC